MKKNSQKEDGELRGFDRNYSKKRRADRKRTQQELQKISK